MTHNRQESGYARAGKELPAAEFLIHLNARLTVSKNAGLFNGLNKIRTEVLRCSRSGEGFDLAWKPCCLGSPQLGAEEARDMLLVSARYVEGGTYSRVPDCSINPWLVLGSG